MPLSETVGGLGVAALLLSVLVAEDKRPSKVIGVAGFAMLAFILSTCPCTTLLECHKTECAAGLALAAFAVFVSSFGF